MADDDNVELIQKRTTDALKQIGNDLEALNRKAKDVTGVSGGIGKLDVAMGGLAKTMLGATGVAAGFYQVAKSMESVAIAAVQMQNLARDSGYAFRSVGDMQGAMRLMGATSQEASRTIGNLGEKLQSLAVFKEGSEIWQGMAKFPGAGGAIANTLMSIAKEGMRTGDQMGATLKMLELFNKQSPETKFAWAQVWGEQVSTLEKLERKLRIMRDLALPEVDPAKLEKSLETWVQWELKVGAIYNNVSAHAIEKLQEIYDAESKHGTNIEGIIKGVNSFIDEGAGYVKATVKDVETLIAAYEKLKGYVKGPLDSLDKFMGFETDDGKGPQKPKGYGAFPGGVHVPPALLKMLPKSWGGTGSNDNGTSTSTDFSGRRRTTDELIETEKDSSKTLIEIRDTLQRMETSPVSGGAGGGGGNNNTFDIGTGIRGGNARASLGGFRPNRGQGGLSSADDQVGAGLSGSAFMAARRARMAEEAKDPGLRERLMAMMHSEGTPQQSLESLANRMDYSGRSLSAGLTPAFYGPMRDGKFNAALAKVRSDPKLQAKYNQMIDNVLVKGSNELGGRTDQGMPSDPNGMWGYGTPVWMKKGGNVFTDWGGGPGGHKGAARYREMIERGTAGEIEARNKIDQQASGPDKWSGGLNAKVEFLNVPPGVKTSADRVGDAFNELQISRTRQGGVYGQNYGYE